MLLAGKLVSFEIALVRTVSKENECATSPLCCQPLC